MCSTLFSTSAQVALNSSQVWWVFCLSPDDIIIYAYSTGGMGYYFLLSFVHRNNRGNVAMCNAVINHLSESVY